MPQFSKRRRSNPKCNNCNSFLSTQGLCRRCLTSSNNDQAVTSTTATFDRESTASDRHSVNEQSAEVSAHEGQNDSVNDVASYLFATCAHCTTGVDRPGELCSFCRQISHAAEEEMRHLIYGTSDDVASTNRGSFEGDWRLTTGSNENCIPRDLPIAPLRNDECMKCRRVTYVQSYRNINCIRRKYGCHLEENLQEVRGFYYCILSSLQQKCETYK